MNIISPGIQLRGICKLCGCSIECTPKEAQDQEFKSIAQALQTKMAPAPVLKDPRAWFPCPNCRTKIHLDPVPAFNSTQPHSPRAETLSPSTPSDTAEEPNKAGEHNTHIPADSHHRAGTASDSHHISDTSDTP